jgi:TonB family protein
MLVAVVLALPVGRAVAATIPNDKVAEPPVVGGPNDVEYLRQIHAHVHKRWAENFLALIGQNLPLDNPLNDPTRVAEVDVVISADGKLASATITKGSGFAGFDETIPEVLRDSAPFPKPPQGVRSDDDAVHVHWTFARDERRCAGLVILHVDDPLDVAIPKLVRAGRGLEMVNRIAAARAGGLHAEPTMSALAVEWLHGAAKQPWTNVKIAGQLAGRGDADAIAWLKTAVKKPDLARAAGAILAADKLPVCPSVKADLEGGSPAAQLSAAHALETSTETACVPGLVKLLENPKAKVEARVAAATALSAVDDDGARAALATATKDDNVAVRAAALLAQIRPGAGRAKLFAKVHIVKDPAIEMRAAGSAGVVRAAGDSDFDDLYMLFKDTDPRPAEATLHELDHVTTAESTKMIAKLMRRPLVPVQRTAAEILVRRHATETFPAFKMFVDPPASDAELRGLGLVAVDDAKLASFATDPKMGVWVYRALLARNERDRAADWLLSQAGAMTPDAQADAMVDWLASVEPPTASASKSRH